MVIDETGMRDARWTQAAMSTKRLLDVAFVLASAPVWLPVCALLALAVWAEDRAFPLFLQPRVGKGGHPFMIWKLRTMAVSADTLLQAKLAEAPSLRREWDTYFRLDRDPRCTHFGRFLRHFSLDELPQLVNVLRGEMALVGPRPLPDYHLATLPSEIRELRESVRPGMTGLWQVSGRSDLSNEGIMRYDVYYVRNWSLLLDAKILARTVWVVFTGVGAY